MTASGPRLVVVGTSGAGKTTVARQVAAALDIPHVELDALWHDPGWVNPDEDTFRERVRAATAEGPWVVDGNYSVVRDLVWPRAQTLVWLDYTRRLVMWRVVTRTLRRVITREELWNGNREPWTNLYRWEPERNIMRWAWTRHPLYREKIAAAVAAPEHGHLQVVRLRSPAETANWLERTSSG